MLNPVTRAAGRIFCDVTTSSDQESLVWTQDAGHLLAWASGGPHVDVLLWWSQIHHNIYLGGPAMKGM